MSGVIARSAVAPVMAGPSVRTEQVTQLVLGESASVLESSGEWRRVRTHVDAYEGWVNEGYLHELDEASADEWRRRASWLSLGARLSVGSDLVILPLRARLAEDDGLVVLPDGRAGRVIDGMVGRRDDIRLKSLDVAPEDWALEHFHGAPYQWGGVTPLGVDCSGLVQTTFAFRGITLPRDSGKQVECGTGIDRPQLAPGDLLFFRSASGAGITHVAIAGADDTIVHSTIACGGVVREGFGRDTRAGRALAPLLVAVRRVTV